MKSLLRALVLVVLVLAAAAGGYFWRQSRSQDGEVKYRLAKIQRGSIASVVVASGTLNAVSTVQVAAPISGQVKEVFADFNTPVRKGEVIARLDPAAYELRLDQARADLDSAVGAVAVARSNLAAQQAELDKTKATLADLGRDLERKRLLVDKKFISPAQLERARALYETTREQEKGVRAQIRVSEAQVQSALAAVRHRESLLRQAQADLERTVIRAPVDGTVVLRNVDAGQTVAASPQAPVLFSIARDLRDMEVEAAIDEADVKQLRIGLPASFRVDAFPRRNFAGEVKQIRKSPRARNAVSYTLVISAPNPDLALLPGMTANVRIVLDSRGNVLKVPNAALLWRPAPGRSQPGAGRVYVLENGAPKPVDVRLGLTDGSSTELIGGGLAEGSEVIVGVAQAVGVQPSSGLGRLLKGRLF